MPRGKKTPISTEEILATIARSAFPSVVTEGDEDVIVFRKLEDEFSHIGLTIIPAGGRNAVLKVFDLRHKLPAKARVVFIVDRDLWVFTGIPDQFHAAELVFTDGYAIENDMFRDGDLEALLTTATERERFATEIQAVCRWYALAVNRRISGQNGRLDIHPNELLDDEGRRTELMALKCGEPYPEDFTKHITAEYSKVLRGKTLLDLFIRQKKDIKEQCC
jgi:hypothetical protein